jgi:hypothetical protein
MSEEMTLAEMRRGADAGEDMSEACRRYEAAHPARTGVLTYLDSLFRLCRPKHGAIETRRDRERKAAWLRLSDSVHGFAEMFVDAPLDVENFVFAHVLEIMRSTFDVGGLLVPDVPRAGRDAQREQANQKRVLLTHAVQMYLAATEPTLEEMAQGQHVLPGKEMKVSDAFAAKIRPAILDALGLSEKSKADVWPTESAIKKVLLAINRGGF